MPRARTPEERAAKLAAARAVKRSNPAPQAKKGDLLALQHGAYSSAVYQPLVEAKLAAWLADPDFPHYAKALPQRFTLRSLARVEVRLELLYEVMEDQAVEESLTEVTRTRETVTGGGEQGGPMKRRATQEKRRDYDETIRRWETLRLNLSKELGLTPMAQTRMGRDVAAAKVDLAKLIEEASREDGLMDEGEVG